MKRFFNAFKRHNQSKVTCALTCAVLGVVLTPNGAFAAPNDLDGDGKSDLSVVRSALLGGECGNPAIPRWANCAFANQSTLNSYLTRKSSDGQTTIQSLFSTSFFNGYHYYNEHTVAPLEGRSVIFSHRNRVNLQEGLEFDKKKIYELQDGVLLAYSLPPSAKQLQHSLQDLVSVAFNNEPTIYMHSVLDIRIGINDSLEPTPILDMGSASNGKTIFAVTKSAKAINPETLVFDRGLPVAADYSGDGIDELAVWNETTGVWTIRNIETDEESEIQWGLPGDHPMTGDYDGDSKADLVVFRPSNGYWYILTSSSGFDYQNAKMIQFGLPPRVIPTPSGDLFYAEDIPVSGDYDGDGTLDLCVYRTDSGTWFYKKSSNQEIVSIQWGLPKDSPVGMGAKHRKKRY